MHNIYLPEIDGSEDLSFVIGTTNCLRESCLHKAHVDVRGVSPFTDTAGDMLLSEISLSWLHKEDANIFLAANNSTLLSTHFFSFALGFISKIFSPNPNPFLFCIFYLFIELSSKSCFYFSFALSVVVLSRLLSLF